MSTIPTPSSPTDEATDQASPACVMSFNASDASGAAGLAGDVATIAAMGAHALPVVTTIVMRDTAEIFDQHVIDGDVIVAIGPTTLVSGEGLAGSGVETQEAAIINAPASAVLSHAIPVS